MEQVQPHDMDVGQRLEGEVGPLKFALNGKDVITMVILASALGAMLFVFTTFLKETNAVLHEIKQSAAMAITTETDKHEHMIDLADRQSEMVTRQHAELMSACRK